MDLPGASIVGVGSITMAFRRRWSIDGAFSFPRRHRHGPFERIMNTTQTTAIEPGCRIRLPEEWAESLGMQYEVILVRTDEGILVRPRHAATWDEVFADKLRARPGDDSTAPDVKELTGDDILF
jgi:hypothetical protein